jgi:hypothetical protein
VNHRNPALAGPSVCVVLKIRLTRLVTAVPVEPVEFTLATLYGYPLAITHSHDCRLAREQLLKYLEEFVQRPESKITRPAARWCIV